MEKKEDAGGEATAIPFVTCDEKGKFTIHPEASARLQKVVRPIAVVAVVGMYRTGKSFLLNTLVRRAGHDEVSRGFEVGSTVNACTKGIWLWGDPVRMSTGEDCDVLFIDTEGLGSPNASQTHDCKIFALALLLASHFVYNSRGNIDGPAIENLSLVVSLTKHIHVQSRGADAEDDGSQFSAFFPSFLWVVRDFMLQLKGPDGRPIDPKTYLERALKPQPGMSEDQYKTNKIRMMLSSFFQERDCVTLVQPIVDEAILKDLAAQDFATLRPEFQAGIQSIEKKLFEHLKPKSMYGANVNGPMLVQLAETYVSAINSGTVPTISTAWDRVVEAQCREAVELAFEAYDAEMAKLTAVPDAASAPASFYSYSEADTKTFGPLGRDVLEEDELKEAHTRAKVVARTAFDERSVQGQGGSGGDDGAGGGGGVMEPHLVKLRAGLKERLGRHRAENEAASERYCQAFMRSVQESTEALPAPGADGAAAAGDEGTPSTGVEGGSKEERKAEGKGGGDAAADKDDEGEGSGGSGEGELSDGVAGRSGGRRAAPKMVLPGVVRGLRVYKSSVERVADEYLRGARGPAKWKPLVSFLSATMPDAVVEWGEQVEALQREAAGKMRQALADTSVELVAAKGREESQRQINEDERRAFEKSLTDAEVVYEREKRHISEQAEVKQNELQRALDDANQRAAIHKEQHSRVEETLKGVEGELVTLRGKHEEHRAAFDEERRAAHRELQEAERRWHGEEKDHLAARGKLEREAVELARDHHQARLDQEKMHSSTLAEQRATHDKVAAGLQKSLDKAHAAGKKGGDRTELHRMELEAVELKAELKVSAERLRSLEAELGKVNEHSALLAEHLNVTKDLLSAKNGEVAECEYQWAATKARLAQSESDKMDMEADLVHVLEPLAIKLKHALSKKGLDLKELGLDEMQSKRLGALA